MSPDPRQVKVFGKITVGLTLAAIGCKLLLVEDSEQTAKMRARIKPRERPIRKPAPGGCAL
jgi:hypothetical protein